MARREVKLGIVGCGLMGRELASASARWFHLEGLEFAPRIVAACDLNPVSAEWMARNLPGVELVSDDYRRLLSEGEVEAIYCAVPHNLHEQLYVDIIRAGKHLLGEKPFGIDLAANRSIMKAVQDNPQVLVRCSSEFPYFPGACRIAEWVRQDRFGRIIEVEAGFWHSSDLDPNKPINWKRRVETNGEYGCMGDLGMHVVHMPFRFGWIPTNVRALLSKIVGQRPDGRGNMVPCPTWDNAILAYEVRSGGGSFPMMLSTKRIAPGHGNTWFIRVLGTAMSAEFSTKNPKEIRVMEYEPGGRQAWQSLDATHESAYLSITGKIFEFGFSDAVLQMLAAFLDELANGKAPFGCVTPEEAALSHRLFTAALESQRTGQTVEVG